MRSEDFDFYERSAGESADHSSTLAVVNHRLFEGEALDGVYRGRPPGIGFLGVTNRRLIMLETSTDPQRLALTSVPLTRVTSVAFLPTDAGALEQATSICVKVTHVLYELNCRDHTTAREAHDLVIWRLISG